jgi:hypothetical protein
MKAMLSRWATPFRFDEDTSVIFEAGSVSPVKLDSSIERSYACVVYVRRCISNKHTKRSETYRTRQNLATLKIFFHNIQCYKPTVIEMHAGYSTVLETSLQITPGCCLLAFVTNTEYCMLSTAEALQCCPSYKGSPQRREDNENSR